MKVTEFLVSQISPHCKLFKGKELKRTLMWTNTLLNQINGLIFVNTIDTYLNEVFHLFLLCYVLSQLRKEVGQGIILVYYICQPEEEALWQLWLLSSASLRRKGSNFIKWPQLYFNFEV